MVEINKVFEEAQKLKWNIGSLLKLSGYERNGDLSDLNIDYEDSEQLFLIEELRKIMEKLDVVNWGLKYLSRPIKETSRLHKNRSGRYETSGGHSYTSGNGIEALVPDDYSDVNRWVRTRVEHDGKDYYLVGHHDVSMEGLTVRIREEV